MQLFHETHIDFLSIRKSALVVSSALMLVGLVSLFLKGGPQYGIDFLGGTELHVQFKHEQKTSDLREAMSAIGFGHAEIKQFGGARDYLVRVQEQQVQGTQISDKVIEALQKAFPQDPPEVRSVESVGPKIGQELRTKAVGAVVISLGLILAYISIRFEVIFAVGAVIALFYNVLMTLGIFSLLNLEIGLAVVAAFLTLVGYSINDTIVVFDRIRENLKLHRRENLGIERLINLSLNQTLSRTILTGLMTLMMVVILYFFGGEVIHNFAFCMLIGILIGTYSSVYIAAPLVVGWYKKHEVQKAKRSPVAVR